ncbi:MAG: hypothetical protein IPK59_19570 [Rhodospirillaceae bacterium]|nr:hypothetical protein [Rhodospirillaceae bacterium]
MSRLKPIYSADLCDAAGIDRHRFDSWRALKMLGSSVKQGQIFRRVFVPRDVLRFALLNALIECGYVTRSADRVLKSLDSLAELADVGSVWADRVFSGKPTPEAYLLFVVGPDGRVIDAEHRTGLDRAADVVTAWIKSRPLTKLEQIGRVNITQIARDAAAKLRERGCL